jgi:hypothetical protein
MGRPHLLRLTARLRSRCSDAAMQRCSNADGADDPRIFQRKRTSRRFGSISAGPIKGSGRAVRGASCSRRAFVVRVEGRPSARVRCVRLRVVRALT